MGNQKKKVNDLQNVLFKIYVFWSLHEFKVIFKSVFKIKW